MGRVSKETIEKLNDFLGSLPDEVLKKCALCKETLTHTIKQAEVKTKAGTKTIADELTEQMNKNAAPGDQVTSEQLRQKTLRHSGERRDICANRTNNIDVAPLVEVPRDAEAVVENIKRLRKRLVNELHHLGKMIKEHRLNSDRPLKKIEDQLRLIFVEAEILGLKNIQPKN